MYNQAKRKSLATRLTLYKFYTAKLNVCASPHYLGFQIDVEKFFIFFLTLALLAFSAASLAFAISSRVAVVGVANLLISMMYVLSMVREQNNSHFSISIIMLIIFWYVQNYTYISAFLKHMS